MARGHVKAINYIFTNPGLDIINLGTGVGYSVLDMVKAFAKACGKEIPYEIKPRREGDIAMCYADPAKAARVLGWKAEPGLRRDVARIPGDGSPRIQTATKIKKKMMQQTGMSFGMEEISCLLFCREEVV